MSEFGAYLAALFLKLIPVLGAGPFLIDRLITWFWPKGRKWLDAHPQRQRIYLWAFLISLFFAGFVAWKNEHDLYMSAVTPAKNQETFLSVGPPFAGRVVVGGLYLPEEIIRMIQAVGKLGDIMHSDIKPTFEAAKSSIGNWGQQVRSEGVPAFAKTLSDDANKLESSSKDIDHILSENARYDSELRSTVHDRAPGQFVQELHFFASNLSSTVGAPDQVREAVLKSDLTRLQQAISTYDNWVYAATDNADYKILSLRAYKPGVSR